MAYTHITTDHNVIKQWAISHGGRPKVLEYDDERGSVIGPRLDFPGSSDEVYDIKSLEHEASWDQFFDVFDSQGLAFEYDIDCNERERFPVNCFRFIKRNLA